MAKKTHKSNAAGSAAYDGFDSLQRTRFDVRNMLIIAAAAIVVRLLFLVFSYNNNPLLLNPIMDGLYHHEWAQRILTGEFWGDDVFFRAPLYPYFLAGLYKLSGSSVAFAIIVQQLLGVATSLLIYVLAREYFKPAIALLAGITAALYWPFVYFEGDLLIVSLVLFLNTTALILLARSLRTNRTMYFLAAGAVLGMSAIARPSIVIFLPAIPLIYYLHERTGKRWLKQSLLVFVAVALVILPVTVRNYVVGRDLVAISSQGGVNFYIGNNAQSDGRTAVVPGTRWDWWGGYQDAIAIAQRARGRSLKPSEVSNYFFQEGARFVFGSPDQSLSLTATKLRMFWAGGERSNNKYIYFFWKQSGIGWLPLPGFWLIAPFGLAGMFLLWSRRRRLSMLYLFVLLYMLGVIAFFVNARFRLPVVPVMIIFAAYATVYLWRSIRDRNGRKMAGVLALLVAFVIVNADFVTFRENKTHADSLSHYTLGNAYLKMDDADSAIREYEEARDIHRRYPTPGYRLIARNVDYNLGRLYWTRGECNKALPVLDSVGGNDQFTIVAMEMMADCQSRLSRFDEAVTTYSDILRVAPQNDKARNGLARAAVTYARNLEEQGQRARAAQMLDGVQGLLPHNRAIANELERLQGG